MLIESKKVGGELQIKLEEIYIDAPADLILQAKQTIQKLKIASERSPENTIVVEQVQNTPHSDSD